MPRFLNILEGNIACMFCFKELSSSVGEPGFQSEKFVGRYAENEWRVLNPRIGIWSTMFHVVRHANQPPSFPCYLFVQLNTYRLRPMGLLSVTLACITLYRKF